MQNVITLKVSLRELRMFSSKEIVPTWDSFFQNNNRSKVQFGGNNEILSRYSKCGSY